ncbi:hypothetical protein M0805_006143 [Coniferiporia weirii]|nr:hypothetical protein M0805_006143 [Coniferiporia weirii]
MTATPARFYIRRARKEDAPALSRICLLTGDAGGSAESLHTHGELPGLVYALPYVLVPHTAGFVLARKGPTDTDVDADEVVGYLLLALDTRAFEAAAEREWYPPLRAKYPKPAEGAPPPVCNPELTDADKRFISLLHAPAAAPEACVAFSPVHLHIDILPEGQRQGWGRRLIDAAVTYLRDEQGQQRLWLGMDPRNADAGRFYARLGFKPIEGAPENCVGLSFSEWAAGKGLRGEPEPYASYK